MQKDGNGDIAHDFLGSAHVFTSAVEEVLEKRLLEETAGRQLTLSQFKLLKMVALTEARTISDVGLFLGISNAAASKAVDKLVRRKLLRRTEGQPDRREIRLSLTESSRRLLSAYAEGKERKLAYLFQGFSYDELRRAARLLDRLSAGLIDHHSNPDDVCLQCGIYFRDKCLVRQYVKRNCFYSRNRRESKHSHPAHDDSEPSPGTYEQELEVLGS
ncbi:MAG: MarR family transcriptional regulator [Terriglobales bacterium]|jgi:DNA-binding MarR family transcriptional regulator